MVMSFSEAGRKEGNTKFIESSVLDSGVFEATCQYLFLDLILRVS